MEPITESLEQQEYFIISLCHTMKHEHWVTLWRPNNAGYCYGKAAAGRYTKIEEGYHNSEGNMPIKIEEAEKLFQTAMYDGAEREMIPNHAYLWRILGVKMTRDGLKRI